MNRNSILVQEWEEIDNELIFKDAGYSLHLNELSWKDYIDNVWETFPPEVKDHAYRPKGLRYYANVPDDVYEEILESRFGIRVTEQDPLWLVKDKT